MELNELSPGKNSVLFGFKKENVLYEKLSNTIHVDKREKLVSLQKRIESIDYEPLFEAESLRKKEGDSLDVLLLEATEKCNLNCSYCIYSGNYVNERIATSRNMPFDTAKRAIDNLIPLSQKDVLIGFYGGEPLLNMDLIEQVMIYSKNNFPSKNMLFSMTTNFFHAENYIQKIVDNGMYINLSLDGPKEIHDRFRRTKTGEPTYERIIFNLKKVEEYSPGYTNSHFCILSTCHDTNDLGKIVEYFDKNNYFVSNINKTNEKGKIRNVESAFLKCDNSHLIRTYQQKILEKDDPKTLRRIFDHNLKTIALRSKDIMPKQLMLHGSCYPGKKRIFVDVDGIYHPCERFGSRLAIGSVKEGMQKSLIEKYINKFAEIRNSLCRECWAQRLCTPCLQYAKDPEGEISLSGLSQTCDGKRKQLLTGIHNYATLVRSDKQGVENYVKEINPLFERG